MVIRRLLLALATSFILLPILALYWGGINQQIDSYYRIKNETNGVTEEDLLRTRTLQTLIGASEIHRTIKEAELATELEDLKCKILARILRFDYGFDEDDEPADFYRRLEQPNIIRDELDQEGFVLFIAHLWFDGDIEASRAYMRSELAESWRKPSERLSDFLLGEGEIGLLDLTAMELSDMDSLLLSFSSDPWTDFESYLLEKYPDPWNTSDPDWVKFEGSTP